MVLQVEQQTKQEIHNHYHKHVHCSDDYKEARKISFIEKWMKITAPMVISTASVVAGYLFGRNG